MLYGRNTDIMWMLRKCYIAATGTA